METWYEIIHFCVYSLTPNTHFHGVFSSSKTEKKIEKKLYENINSN